MLQQFLMYYLIVLIYILVLLTVICLLNKSVRQAGFIEMLPLCLPR